MWIIECELLSTTTVHVHVYTCTCMYTLLQVYMTCTCMYMYIHVYMYYMYLHVLMSSLQGNVSLALRIFNETCFFVSSFLHVSLINVCVCVCPWCGCRVVLLSQPLTVEGLLDQLQAWFPGHRFIMYHYSTEVSPAHSLCVPYSPSPSPSLLLSSPVENGMTAEWRERERERERERGGGREEDSGERGNEDKRRKREIELCSLPSSPLPPSILSSFLSNSLSLLSLIPCGLYACRLVIMPVIVWYIVMLLPTCTLSPYMCHVISWKLMIHLTSIPVYTSTMVYTRVYRTNLNQTKSHAELRAFCFPSRVFSHVHIHAKEITQGKCTNTKQNSEL